MSNDTAIFVDKAFPFNTKRGKSNSKMWDYWNRVKRTIYTNASRETIKVKDKILAICKFCGDDRSQDLAVMARHTKSCASANANAQGKAGEHLAEIENNRSNSRKRRRSDTDAEVSVPGAAQQQAQPHPFGANLPSLIGNQIGSGNNSNSLPHSASISALASAPAHKR